MVKATHFDDLLPHGKIAAFQRMNGWVFVGKDPIRGIHQKEYIGLERRGIVSRVAVGHCSREMPNCFRYSPGLIPCSFARCLVSVFIFPLPQIMQIISSFLNACFTVSAGLACSLDEA